MNQKLLLTFAAGFVTTIAVAGNKSEAERPNVIVILADDLGSTDVGFNGCKDILTPNIDRIANEGVKCTQAYISAPYSGPSRAGLMTGRCQQRFGVDGNIEDFDDSVREKQGVPTTELMLLELMQRNGYRTASIGKWHMGDAPELKPENRGADYSYGFSGGGYSYWGLPSKNKANPVEENGKPVPLSEITYLTDNFSEKAVEFIDKSSDDNEPFFLYLAYNAPHAPLQATQKYLDRTEHIYNKWRTVYAAMILAMDDGIGTIWDVLEEKGIEDNTIIVFLSDNGGVAEAMNYPRRAFKGNMFEGGITTPFAMYYKGKIEGGSTYDEMISSLDIFPTVAAAAGIDVKEECENKLDGVNIVPFINNEVLDKPHDQLCWRVCNGMEYAIRRGDYKMVKRHDQEQHMLYNIANDPCEMFDIAAQYPNIVESMKIDYDKWDAELMDQRWEDLHAPHQVADLKAWKQARKNALRPGTK